MSVKTVMILLSWYFCPFLAQWCVLTTSWKVFNSILWRQTWEFLVCDYAKGMKTPGAQWQPIFSHYILTFFICDHIHVHVNFLTFAVSLLSWLWCFLALLYYLFGWKIKEWNVAILGKYKAAFGSSWCMCWKNIKEEINAFHWAHLRKAL